MSQTKKSHPTIKITRKHRHTFLGVIIYLLMVIAIVWISPLIILNWIAKSSSNPVITLWAIGIFLSSVIYGFIKLSGSLSINFSLFNIKLDAVLKKTARFFSLPYPALAILLVIGATGIILTRPLCQPPVVAVTATYENGEVKSVSPGGMFNTTFDSSVVFTASTLNTKAIACQWDYAGNAILSLEPQTGCVIRIAFSQEQGEIGVVTLNAMDSQCSQRNIFPFNVEIK